MKLVRIKVDSNAVTDFANLYKEFKALSWKSDEDDLKRKEIAESLAKLKKGIYAEFYKEALAMLEQGKKRGTEANQYFLGSLANNIDTEFTKKIAKKDYPSWTSIFDDMIRWHDDSKKYKASKGYKPAIKKAFEQVYGKGSWQQAIDANKKIR